MKAPTEQDILRGCLDWLALHRIPAWRQNQGLFCDAQGRRRLRGASASGISDIIGVLPPSGKLLAVEVKRPGKKPGQHQQDFLQWVEGAGGVGACVHSVDELAAIVGNVLAEHE